jgi:hypothetical protein
MAWCLVKAQGHLYICLYIVDKMYTRVCSEVSGLAAWSENCK